ncbi:MAG: CinA family nicotinamide mononucleotide deamidase-related protein [Deltaproteobacteria bacterium]|nr:CinA family nicotinamide mononucleotide deamidase-related protein [Deltaproteobacteria bacterium]
MGGNSFGTDSGNAPTCEIITIGSELLLGQIEDTNTVYLAREMSGLGIAVRFRTTVGDRMDEMQKVIRSAAGRCDLVITTGGLGPTLDDLTREAVCSVAGVDLEYRQTLMDEIVGMFRRYGYEMPENNRRQAYVPAGSIAISNPVGTAPAFITQIAQRPVICLPGVPRELRYLMTHEVLPWIRNRFNLLDHRVSYQVLKVVGLGESGVDRLIQDLIKPGENPEVGLLAAQGEIKIRIAAVAAGDKAVAALIDPVAAEIRSRLGSKIFGQGDDTLEGVIHSLLRLRGLTLALLETFTGGLAAERLFAVPGSRLRQSCVIPDPGRVAEYLGQDRVVAGPESALDLAHRVREKGGADVGLAILGFVEENQGTHPVVKGCAAAAGEGIAKTFSWEMGGDPLTLRTRGAVIGLNTLRLAVLEGIS